MKPIAISFVVALLPACSFAQTTQKLNIDKATVFLKGAELLSTAKVSLTKGENELLFTNVAGNVNTQSIVANATNGVVIESVTFQNNYRVTDNVSPEVKKIKDSIAALDALKEPISNKISAINEQIMVLKANQKVGGDNTGLNVAELQKMLDVVGTKLEGYYNQKDKANAETKKLTDRITALKRQLDEEQKKDYQPGGQLMVKFYAKENASSNITITYVVPSAGWVPTYDVMADDAKGPLKIYYKANIFQNSGVPWNNVRLALSTGNPQEGMQAPELAPEYLSIYVPHTRATNNFQTGEDVFTTETYMNGQYNGTGEFRPSRMNSYSLGRINDDGSIEERDETGHVSLGKSQSGINKHVAVDNLGINTTFDIDLPYTVPSDGQEHLVAVKRYETPAAYEYFAAPKADNDAFLLAKIAAWQELNLLPGKTNIFYEGTYIGQAFIDTRNVQDTMSLSLGRDKKIVVKRERDRTLRSVKMIGTNVKEEYAYNITIRNTRKEPVSVTLQDQLPVSNDKDIVIEDVDQGGASLEETTGLLKWAITLSGNETKTVKFGYTVKYPKGKTLKGN